MYTFDCWVRLNTTQTTHIRVQALNYQEAKMIAEAQFGAGQVLSVNMLNE